MKITRILLAVICTALFCSESFGQMTNVIFAMPTATNEWRGSDVDLVDHKLDYAQRLLDMNYMAAANEETIDAVRVLNNRVKTIVDAHEKDD